MRETQMIDIKFSVNAADDGSFIASAIKPGHPIWGGHRVINGPAAASADAAMAALLASASFILMMSAWASRQAARQV